MVNNDKCCCECKKRHICEIDNAWNPGTCNCEIRKYLASITDDSAITCDEIIESYDEETNFTEKKQPVKDKILMFYLHFD